jgi:hypothetical protein
MILLWRFLVLRTPVYWRREHRERTAETWNAVRKTMIVDLRASSSLALRQVTKTQQVLRFERSNAIRLGLALPEHFL